MSGPYRPGYPGNGGTPLSPASQANQPVSFKTDINRKKTKKWVAAKSYSYDGDDWGDDDDDDDEEEEVPPVPDASRFPHSAAPVVPPIRTSNMVPAQQSNATAESSSTQSPVFVRPADIYRRMQDERERERSSQDSARSNTVPLETAAATSVAAPPTQNNVGSNAPLQQTSGQENGRATAPLVIPEVKRLSGFGQDFFSGTNNPEQAAQSSHGPATQVPHQGSSLHQVPSLGFNSVVHQAFDTAETPSSTTGGFSRSNSDSTSVISPIISSWKSETDKTPTIAEEPAVETSAQEPPANFKPGHRRDLSIPSPGNGPDRFPTVTNAGESQSAEVVMSSSQDSLATPESDNLDFAAARDQSRSGEATPRPLSGVHEILRHPESETNSMNGELNASSEETQPRVPTPLQIPNEEAHNVPVIVPSMSTETSPQDMESDRLRREIMRSFSNDHSAAATPQAQPETPEHEEPKSRPQHESSYLPSEYDSYWGDQGIPPTSPLQLRPATSADEPLSLVINPESAGNHSSGEPASDLASSNSHPKMKKRFSWEASDDSEEDVLEESPAPAPSSQNKSIPPVAVPTPDTTEQPPLFSSDLGAAKATSEEGADSAHLPLFPEYPTAEKEVIEHLEQEAQEPHSELTYFPPAPEPEHEPESEPEIESQPIVEKEGDSVPVHIQPSQPSSNEASLPAFRKIMEIPSRDEKIRVFNDTREQFAGIDSGLSDWIRRSSESLPEHADLIQANGRLPGGAPTSGLPPKAKFPKLSSLGNLSLPSGSSHGSDGTSSGFNPGHARKSSGTPIMNRQNVESRGKDLLHSAGVLGGKAGGAARGLFAKGKSKLRGADKGMSSVFRGQRHRSWVLSTESDAQSSDLSFENEPVNLSMSSRYSLQPVPRIPSLRLSDSRPFRDSFDGEEVFSRHQRSFSADFGHTLRPVTEDEAVALRPGRATSFRRAVTGLDKSVVGIERSEDASSIQDQLSTVDVSQEEIGQYALREETSEQIGTFLDSASSRRASQGDTPGDTPPNESSGAPAVNKSESLRPTADGTDTNVPVILHEVNCEPQSNAPFRKPFVSHNPPPIVAPEVSPPLKHEISRAHSQVSRLSEEHDLGDVTTRNPAFKSTTHPKPNAVGSVNESLRSPVSPPIIQDGGTAPAEYTDRRDSVVSDVSDISQDEMDRIREKFDEEGLYSGPSQPSPTRSQISELTDDEEDEENDALQEKLDEAGFMSEPRKDALEQFPRPPTSTPLKISTAPNKKQPIRVVKLSRFSMMDRQASQSGDNDTRRYSRFSFEGEGNTLAEEMLVNGHGRRSGPNDSNRGYVDLPPSQVPVTLGEDAPDEAPPPFADQDAPFSDDRKEPQADDATPPYEDRVPGSPTRNSQLTRSEDARSPPEYQPIQSPPASQLETIWKTGRLQDLRTNSDSKASSSISPMSNPNVNANGLRTAISPEPPIAETLGQKRLSPDLGGPKSNSQHIDSITAVNKPDRSLWSNGRLSGGKTYQSSPEPLSSASHNGSPSLSQGRRDEDSLGSGDSMAVQAALSRNDLRIEPSPLNQGSETASATSDHSSNARVSMQFRNKIKLMGKKAKGSPANVPPMETQIETKPAEKRKERRADGKKGALSRFGGIFNRSGPTQRPEQVQEEPPVAQNIPPPHVPQYSDSSWGNARASTHDNGHATHRQPISQQQVRSSASYGQRTLMPAQDKALPPPPEGYYAPVSAPNPSYEPATSYPTQSHPYYGNTSRDTYQPTQSTQYSPTESNQYVYQSSSPTQQQPISTTAQSYNTVSPPLGSNRTSSTSPEIELSRSRARELRMRSRSPRPSPVRGTFSRQNANVNYSDPIYNLGKFHAVTETARIGDQSLPFPITLPEDLSNGQLSPRTSIQPESSVYFNNRDGQNAGLGLRHQLQPSIAAVTSGVPIRAATTAALPQQSSSTNRSNTTITTTTPPIHHPNNSNSEIYETGPVLAKNTIPVELPVPNENSDEEIVMSSTAYPGQEWQPAGFENWMPY